MNANLKILLIGLISLGLICCSSSPPPKDEYQQTLDEYQKSLEEYNRLLERQIEQDKKNFEAALNSLENLRHECSVIRQNLRFANYKMKEFQQDNTDFMLQLPDASGFQVWHYDHSWLFVSPELMDEIIRSGVTNLSFSPAQFVAE